jgi:hypothetical protein
VPAEAGSNRAVLGITTRGRTIADVPPVAVTFAAERGAGAHESDRIAKAEDKIVA